MNRIERDRRLDTLNVSDLTQMPDRKLEALLTEVRRTGRHRVFAGCIRREIARRAAEEAAYEAWIEGEEARGDLAFEPDSLPCYECGGFNGRDSVDQKVVRLGPVTGGADPTQSYVLACGHTVI